MKKIFILLTFSLLYLFSYNTFAQTSDLTLQEVLDFINKDSLKRTVQDMQNFGSRLCTKTAGQNRKVAQYLVDRLKTYGIENARIDSFYIFGTHWITGYYEQYMYNVLGNLKGTGETNSTVIIGAHLDAISYDSNDLLTETAPGADDNATGCAVMIEMARVMYEKDIKPFHNIDFMAYDAEEIGLKGAHYDAEKRSAAEENIIVMLNNDMVAHQPIDEIWKVSLRWYTNSLDITEKAEEALNNYTIIKPFRTEEPNSTSSDSYAYFFKNYKVNFAIEQHFSPYYHSINDLTEYLNFEYCSEIAKMNFVLLDYNAGINLPLNIKADRKKLDHCIDVFPNPAIDFIRVHNSNDVVINKIDIYDITGRIILSEQSLMQQQNIIRSDNFSSGIYFLRIFTDRGVVNKKIIKQ
jgi:hypothetical protein